MKKIKLNKNLFIAKGSGRCCFIHPEDDTKVIKVACTKRGQRNDQNSLDYRYINYLRKEKKSLLHVATCSSYVETNFGKGLVFDRIINYDKKSTRSFRYLMVKKLITIEEQKKLLNELKEYLESEDILFVDNSLTNILCQEISPDKYKLVIIDGLGAKREGFKFWLYLNVTAYKRYKIKKQWKILLKSHKRDLLRIEENTNPIIRF